MGLLDEAIRNIKPQDKKARDKARERLDKLTMPHWALGRLMDLAEDLAGMTGSARPPVERKTITVMAADHGVTQEGVSQYPSEVTAQMIFNFVSGGAGVNALARITGAKVMVVDMGVDADIEALAREGKIVSKKIRRATGNIARGPAMSREEAVRCVEAGVELAMELDGTTDVFGTGDMGIGNTTPSSAIISAIAGRPPEDVTGRGTGIDDERLRHKTAIVEKALEVNRPDPSDGLDVLSKVGGFEIGAIAGVILGAASLRKPVVVDGFISTAGALIAKSLAPLSAEYIVPSHLSVEPGHNVMWETLGKRAYLDMNMRLGEGSGAALAMPLLDAAARVLTDIATFEEAAVSQSDK